MRITPALLESALGARRDLAELYAHHIDAACEAYQIDTPLRLAHFLAQVGHESGALIHSREVWGPTAAQERYERNFNAPWPETPTEARRAEFAVNRLAYSLGNVQAGDGKRYCGRGALQTTGRTNYRALRDRLRSKGLDAPDFEAAPELLEQPRWSALAACDYWEWRDINAMADRDDHEAVTRAVNGGTNGIEDRRRRLERVKTALAAVHTTPTTPAAPAPTPANSSDPAQYSQEAGMPLPALAAPFLMGLASSLIDVFTPLAKEKITKEMARHTDKPEVAEQISAALVEGAKALTGKTDPVAAVAAARESPATVQKLEEGALADLDKLLPLLERLNSMEQENIRNAREYNSTEPLVIDMPWVKLRFVHLLSVFFVSFSGWFVTRNWEMMTPELRGSVIMLMMIAGWNGVRDYFMGSSSGSDRKTAMLAQDRLSR